MLAHWDPFTEMSRIQDRMLGRGWTEREVGFRPAVDIYEDDKGIHVKAELPGLKPEDIKVSVENRVLTISGERKLENEEKKDNYHRVERFYGTFNRSFALPHEVATDEIDAKYDEGVLSVSLPRRPETKPREIAIKKG
jgi:HSP20 family protein